MKLRILSEPKYDLWSGKYESTFLVQKKVLFWWETVMTWNQLNHAELYLDLFSKRMKAFNQKPSKKVELEIEV